MDIINRYNDGERDFRGANLCYADLRWVDLRGANLRGANLRGAILRWANLSGADLSGANLNGAILRGAYLRCANLRGANLSGADLCRADLFRADLSDTCLDPAAPVPPVTDAEIELAGLELPGDNYVYGWRTRTSHVGSMVYSPRPDPYCAPVFSVSATTCHPGIYLASRDWLQSHYPEDLVRCYCLRSELHHAGDKWRAKRIWVCG